MKDIQIIIDGKIASYKVSGNTIDLRVEKPEAKPLLADAKVGDKAVRRDGLFTKLEQITDLGYFFTNPLKPSDSMGVGIDGTWDSIGGMHDIIRLIPQGTPEWKELELLAAYPHIERDLTTVQVGDTVLFDNGVTSLVTDTWDDQFNIEIKSDLWFFINWGHDGKQYHDINTGLICLGIIARAVKDYTFMQACDLLDSGEAEAVHIDGMSWYMSYSLISVKYITKKKINDEMTPSQSLIKSERLATNWQIYKR